MGRKPNAPAKPKSNPILDQLIESLEIVAAGELEPREPHFASSPRSKLDAAGELFTAVQFLKDQRDKIDQLTREGDAIKKAADDDRRQIAKLRQRVWEFEVAARTANQTAIAKKAAANSPAAPSPAATPCKDHHWNTSKTPPVCAICGKAKSNRGRKSHSNPAANVAVATVGDVTKIDPPSLPLPLAKPAEKNRGPFVETTDGRVIDLADVEDDFDEGTMRAGR